VTARAHHHPVPLVQEEGRVVRIDPVEREREDARSGARVARAEDAEPRLGLEGRGDATVDKPLLRLDRLRAHPREVVEGRVGPDHAGVVLQAGLEAVRRRAQRVVGERGPLYGLAADEERTEARERRRGGRQDPDPGRTEHLVRADGVEIDPEPVEIELEVRGGLASVEQDQGPAVVRALGDLPHR